MFTRLMSNVSPKPCILIITRKCRSVFGLQDLIRHEKPQVFTINQVEREDHQQAVDIIKKHYLREHVLIQAKKMDLGNDRALDTYLINLLKQGNSTFAKTEDGTVAGLCVSYASSSLDPRHLRNYAFYRQDPNTKEFLYFTAKLQETPNLWDIYQQTQVYEIKMITVLPEFRRQGLATHLAENSKEQAQDQGYKVIRMDCINPYDYKIAERCMLQCIVKFPLHKVRGSNASFIKQRSEFNRFVRVYVDTQTHGPDQDKDIRQRKDLESLVD